MYGVHAYTIPEATPGRIQHGSPEWKWNWVWVKQLTSLGTRMPPPMPSDADSDRTSVDLMRRTAKNTHVTRVSLPAPGAGGGLLQADTLEEDAHCTHRARAIGATPQCHVLSRARTTKEDQHFSARFGASWSYSEDEFGASGSSSWF